LYGSYRAHRSHTGSVCSTRWVHRAMWPRDMPGGSVVGSDAVRPSEGLFGESPSSIQRDFFGKTSPSKYDFLKVFVRNDPSALFHKTGFFPLAIATLPAPATSQKQGPLTEANYRLIIRLYSGTHL
jgi:hypothetical protein